jgi:NADPH-dependent curcumin reductase CurA
MTQSATRIVLAARPTGDIKPEHFRKETFDAPKPGPGEVVLRTLWISVDPYVHGRIKETASYTPPTPIGAPIEGGTVAEVIDGNGTDFKPGDIVLAHSGWQTHAVAKAETLRRIDPKLAPVQTAVGVLGMPGMTAYFGLLDIGQPKPGETVVVAAASGAVGSVVGQIAKMKGARAVGIAGGPDKCRMVKEEAGFDDCVDHRDPDLAGKLKAACPNGINVYFENVGGKVLEAVLPNLANHARIPVCGVISYYGGVMGGDEFTPLQRFMRMMLVKRMMVKGFIVGEYAPRRAEFERDMSQWVREGRIKWREHVVEGLDNAPGALLGLLSGSNVGKALVKLG